MTAGNSSVVLVDMPAVPAMGCRETHSDQTHVKLGASQELARPQAVKHLLLSLTGDIRSFEWSLLATLNEGAVTLYARRP
jgi:hypothetical protein